MQQDPWGEEPAWARDIDGTRDIDDSIAEVDELTLWHGAEHVIALIDGYGHDMHQPYLSVDGNKMNSPLEVAFMACENLCRNRVLQIATHKTGKRDAVGVLVFGAQNDFGENQEIENMDEDDDDDAQEEGSYVMSKSSYSLVELSPPGVKQIQALRSCLCDPINGRQLHFQSELKLSPKNMTENSEGRKLRSALQEANKLFTESKSVKKSSSKSGSDVTSIWIFTNQDNPHKSCEAERRQLNQIFQDIVDSGSEIVVWALPKVNGKSFDTTLLYHNTPCQLNDEFSSLSTFCLEEMLECIEFLGKKPRRLWTIPLMWADWRQRPPEGTNIMIDFYKLVQPQKKPQPKWINQATKQETERVTQTIVKDTGEIVLTSGVNASTSSNRIVHFATFGTDRVPLSPEDVMKIKAESHAEIGTASLILLGFKPQDMIPPMHIVDSSSYLIYPNDTLAEGSTAAFANLHSSMLRKHVVAIGELLTRVTSSSRLVAIYAQDERRDQESNDQQTPPGMIVVNLPFEDDVRAMDSDSREVIFDEILVQKATELIQHQKLENVEIGDNFENAAIKRFWRYIEAVALGTSLPEEEQFETEINEKEIIDVAGSQIRDFKDALPRYIDLENKSNSKPQSRKRKTTLIADESGLDWNNLYRTNSLSQCKVADLRSYLRSVGLRVGGRKDDLILRVTESLSLKESDPID